MKKNAFSLSILFSLLATCLIGCDVKKAKDENGKNILFTVNQKSYTAEDLLGFEDNNNSYNLLKTDEGVAAVYDAIYKVLGANNVGTNSTIDSEVDEMMEDFEDEVESYASSNGVSKSNALKTKLEELGFEDKKELRASYYSDIQKEELVELYKKATMEPSKVDDEIEFNGKSLVEEYVANTNPLIVKHILSKVSDSNTIYNKAQITTDETKKFANILKELVLENFATVSEYSEDSSASEQGNLGIVDNYTSFVPEFKLGLYAYEMIEKGVSSDKFYATDDDKTKVEGLMKNSGNEYVIDVIALGSVLQFLAENVGKTIQEAAGHSKTSEYDADLYPRNALYNKLLNFPGIQFLKVDNNQDTIDERLGVLLVLAGFKATETSALVSEIKDSSYYKDIQANFANKNSSVDSNGFILENGERLFVTKSTYGFHFISVIEDYALTQTDAAKYFMYGSAISSSDTTYVNDKTTYNVDRTKTDYTYTKNRKSEIEERVLHYIKGGFESISTNDKLYEYKMIQYYLDLAKENNNNESIISNTNIREAVENEIELAQNLKKDAIKEAQAQSWEDYIDKLQAYKEAYEICYGGNN